MTGLCTIGIARVAVPAEAGAPVPAASARARRYARTSRGHGGIPQNANSGTNSNAAGPATANGNANSVAPATTNTNQTAGTANSSAGGGGFASAVICKDVNLGPAGPPTADLATNLNGNGGVTAKPLGVRALLLCGPPKMVDSLKGVAQKLTGAAPDRSINETHHVRLFFLRKAAEIADAINRSGRLSSPVKAVGDDLLVFPSESVADDEAIHQFKRTISVLDLPRPELSLMTWSVQISSGSPDTINRESVRIRSAVSGFNDRLKSALEQGWWFLEGSRRKYGDKFYAENLSSYLSNRYLWTKPGSTALPATAPKPPCGLDKYCLGYTRIFKPIQPSLTSMILALVAAQPGGHDDARMRELRDDFVDCLENRTACQEHYAKTQSLKLDGSESRERQTPRPPRPQGYREVTLRFGEPPPAPQTEQQKKLLRLYTADASEDATCEQSDFGLLSASGADALPGPAFYCLREQLHRSLGSGHLGEIRRTLADFLYQYKSAEYYPNDFVAWNQAASSQALDATLDPLIVAFNRDLNVYLRFIQDNVQVGHKTEKKATFESDGIVTARVISGNTAKIETTTQSFFRQPPTLNVRDVVTALAGAPTPTLAPVASGTGAELIAAAIRAEQRMTARVGRNLNLEITSNTLRGASACEMNVVLDSVEADKPSMLNTTAGTSADENLSRVAKHTTNTKVRVDSTKLFEVSSFAAALVHGRSIPLIPPGVDLPYIGSVVRLRLPPGTVYHRSFAIVSAVIVPTAADLANIIEFSEDLEEIPGASGDVQLLTHAVVNPAPTPPPQATPSPARGRRGRSKSRAATPAPATPAPAKAPTSTAYYWIVAHYRDGDSVSGPFRVSDAPSKFDHGRTVTLLWRAPERALSFDVIRTTDASNDFNAARGKRLLIANTTGFAYVDDDDGLRDYTDSVTPRTTFSRITKPAGNLRAFHKAMLDCIEDESRGDAARCADAYLSRQTPEGRGQ